MNKVSGELKDSFGCWISALVGLIAIYVFSRLTEFSQLLDKFFGF